MTSPNPHVTLDFKWVVLGNTSLSIFMLKLDSTQCRAVESGNKTVVVAGPPGSGKTVCVAGRFAHLIHRKTPLSSVLILTFSAATAARLRRSLESIIGGSYGELWLHTHHSFASRVLSLYAMRAGVAGNRASTAPAQITPFKAYLIVKELLHSEERNLISGLKEVALKDGFAREASDFFGLLGQHLIMPDQLAEAAQRLPPPIRDLSRMYSSYSDYLFKNNWVCPGESVSRAVGILRSDPTFAEELRRQFQHILVDEFQEIDNAQLRLIELLALEDSSLFVTGDEDQRIYRFRGSLTNPFERILRKRPSAESIRLDTSYRLPPEVFRASHNLIAHNRETPNGGSTMSEPKIDILSYSDAIEQAYAVARDIKRRVLDGDEGAGRVDYSDFAILCRSTSRSGVALEEAFSYYGVPYILYNSTSFYRHPMTRCVAAFLRLLMDPSDDYSLMRVLSIPRFGLDAIAVKRIASAGRRARGLSLFKILRQAAADGEATDTGTVAALGRFFDCFDSIRERAKEAGSPSSLVHSIMQDLFFGDILAEEDVITGMRDARNLRLLYEVMCDIEGVIAGMRNRCTLADLVENMEHAFAHFSSQQENNPADESADGVRIMTVHQAKGMEIPFVYIIDATEEYFPQLGRAMTLVDSQSVNRMKESFSTVERDDEFSSIMPELSLSVDDQLREERRLAYVAITRAQKELVVCYTQESNRGDPVQPSPFIPELLGREITVEPEPTIMRDASSAQALSQIHSALNVQELESALRGCIAQVPHNDEKRLQTCTKIESLALDSHFICSEFPFETDPERAIDLSDHVYSASQLNTYLVCPRMFYYDRLLNVGPDRPEDFGLGQIIHATIEHFHRKTRNFAEDEEILQARIEQSFQALWNGDGQGGEREPFREKYPAILRQAAIVQKTEKILRRYIATETKGAPDREIVDCEKRIEFKVGDYDFVARIDRIDCIDSGHLIIDFKTSSNSAMKPATIKKRFININGESDFSPKDFQLPLYVIAARAAGYDPVEMIYYWLSLENSEGMFKQSSLRLGEADDELLSEAEIAAAEDNIIAITTRIAAGKFEPAPVTAYECSRCAFGGVCARGEEEQNGA